MQFANNSKDTRFRKLKRCSTHRDENLNSNPNHFFLRISKLLLSLPKKLSTCFEDQATFCG